MLFVYVSVVLQLVWFVVGFVDCVAYVEVRCTWFVDLMFVFWSLLVEILCVWCEYLITLSGGWL